VATAAFMVAPVATPSSTSRTVFAASEPIAWPSR
jgi:hypothetical protein